MGVTRGWLPQTAGSPIPVGGGDAAAVPPKVEEKEEGKTEREGTERKGSEYRSVAIGKILSPTRHAKNI